LALFTEELPMTTKFLKQWGKKQQGSKTYPWF